MRLIFATPIKFFIIGLLTVIGTMIGWAATQRSADYRGIWETGIPIGIGRVV